MKVKRRPIRAFFGGLIMGLGIAILLATYAKIAYGRPTFVILVIAVTLVSVLLALFAPARGPRPDSPPAAPADTV